jgi:hypothetical protein
LRHSDSLDGTPADADRPGHQQHALEERGQMLRFAVPELMFLVGRLFRHGEENEVDERGEHVASRIESR